MSAPAPGITQLLIAWGDGDQAVLDQIIPLVHRELQQIAPGAGTAAASSSRRTGPGTWTCTRKRQTGPAWTEWSSPVLAPSFLFSLRQMELGCSSVTAKSSACSIWHDPIVLS